MQILATGGYVALQQNCCAMQQCWSQVSTNSCAGCEAFEQKKAQGGIAGHKRQCRAGRMHKA
jgi:hypothetical protein